MHSCVYTTQKTKKAKKWIDGFVSRLKSSIVLYNEDKKEIHRAQFKVREDGLIETTGYFIYIDSDDSFLKNGRVEESSAVSTVNQDDEKEKEHIVEESTSESKNERLTDKMNSATPDPELDTSSQKKIEKPLAGRTSKDILGLFE